MGGGEIIESRYGRELGEKKETEKKKTGRRYHLKLLFHESRRSVHFYSINDVSKTQPINLDRIDNCVIQDVQACRHYNDIFFSITKTDLRGVVVGENRGIIVTIEYAKLRRSAAHPPPVRSVIRDGREIRNVDPTESSNYRKPDSARVRARTSRRVPVYVRGVSDIPTHFSIFEILVGHGPQTKTFLRDAADCRPGGFP